MFITELEYDLPIYRRRAFHRVLRDHAAFILHFHVEVLRRQEWLRKINDLGELACGKPVVVVAPKPYLQLHVGDGTHGAPAIDEVLCDVTNLSHVKVSGNGLAIVKNESDLLVRTSVEVLLKGA